MAVATLTTLLPELQMLIVDLVSRPTDLRSLCLTCKVLRSLATPKLYYHFVVDAGDLYRWLPALTSKNNPGIPHIRVLSFIKNDYEDHNYVDVMLALSLLPPNILRDIRIPFSPDSWEQYTLQSWLHQKRLKTIHVTGFGERVCDIMVSSGHNTDLTEVEDLAASAVPEPAEDYERHFQCCGKYIAMFPKLASLKIKLFERDEQLAWYNGQNSDILEDTMELLFPGGLSLTMLRKLCLQCVSFNSTSEKWIKATNMPHLRCLELSHCSGFEVLLKILGNHFRAQGSSLEELTIVESDLTHGRDDQTTSTDSVFEEFLISFSGLRVLRLTRNSSAMKSSWIERHAETLRVLSISDFSYPFKLCDETLCSISCCQNLRQLAIEQSVYDKLETQDMGRPNALLECVSKCQHLRTLRLFGVPAIPSTTRRSQGPRRKLRDPEHVADNFASTFVAKLNSLCISAGLVLRLRVLAFTDMWHVTTQPIDPFKIKLECGVPRYYTLQRMPDTQEIVPCCVEPYEVKYDEPESDLLDFRADGVLCP